MAPWQLQPDMSTPEQEIRHRLLLARLPAMPQILLKLLALCQTEEAGMAEFAQLVRKDAGMSAKVLRVAGSAAYHRGGQPADLFQALNVLGADTLKMLVISESVFQTFNSFPNANGLDLNHFWRHTLTTAVMARDIARKMAYPQMEEAYLAGLLHDVGRLALLAAAPAEYSASLRLPDDQKLCAHEQRSLHITHAEAGAWLIERWQLDSFIADSVLYHHEPALRIRDAHPLIRIVHLAHLLGDLAPGARLPEGAGQLCALPDADLPRMLEDATTQVVQEAELLGVDISALAPPASVASPPTAPADPVQLGLLEEVRNTTLTTELGRALAVQQDESGLLALARQSAHVLFQLEDALVFLLDDRQEHLVCASAGMQQRRLSGFSVPLAGGGSVTESALQKRIAFIGHAQGLPTLVEDQLLRILHADGLVCVPLASGTRCLGVMVGGFSAHQLSDLRRQERLLQSFGAKVAAALEAVNRQRSAIEHRLADAREQYTSHARKMAHEVSNPLTIIRNYLGVLDDKLSRREMPGGEIAILTQEIDRVGGLIHEFAEAVPRAGSGPTEIHRVVSDLVRLFQDSQFLPPGVRITTRLSEPRALFDGPADTLKQVLMNLLKNAVEALSANGGVIDIASQGPVHHEGRQFFELSIKDNGPGLPRDVLAKLFSPVHSLKGGANRGLGLSIVNDLLKQAGGQISCTSTAEGTTFRLLLPAGSDAAASPSHSTAKENA